MNRLSVKIQLTLWYALTMGATFILLGSIILVLVKTSLYQQIDSQVDANFDLLITEFKKDPGELIELEVNKIIEQFSIDEIKTTPGDTKYGQWSMYDSGGWVKADLDSAINDKSVDRSVIWNSPDYQTYHVRQGIMSLGQNSSSYLISVARLATETHQTLDSLRAGLWFALPAALLIASLAGYWLAGRSLQPLREITKSVERINSNRILTHLEVLNPKDEIGRLAQALNQGLDRIDKSYSRLSKFTADAAHQLRTPLTAIRSVGELSLGQQLGPAQCKESICSLLEEASRLEKIVDNLLMLACADANEIDISIQPVSDITVVVRDVLEALQVLADEKQQTITLINDKPISVLIDTELFKQGLINIIHNAIVYTQSGGKIDITVAIDSGQGVVTVSDNGPGITQKEASHIFDRFYRGEMKHEQSGTGLGLSVAQKVIKLAGGNLLLDQSSDREGAIFNISLPLADS